MHICQFTETQMKCNPFKNERNACIYLFSQSVEAIGDCTTDTFSISGGKNGGTPVICGTNTGYHSRLCFG